MNKNTNNATANTATAHKFQICILEKDENGKNKVKSAYIVNAENLRQATIEAERKYATRKHHTHKTTTINISEQDAKEQWANLLYTDKEITERKAVRTICEAQEQDNGETVRVYPYCTPTDGESWFTLAEFTLRSFENWERRNDNAVLEPFRRTEQDRQDFIMVACETFATIFAENPHADMYTLKSRAFSAIATEQKRRDRNREKEYFPDYRMDTLVPVVAKSTHPTLDRIVREAIETADLTEKQMQYVNLAYAHGLSIANIAETVGGTKTPVACVLYAAQYKILLRMVELDRTAHAIEKAGYTADDIAETLATLKKRARVK